MNAKPHSVFDDNFNL